jgi:hypothetical protein
MHISNFRNFRNLRFGGSTLLLAFALACSGPAPSGETAGDSEEAIASRGFPATSVQVNDLSILYPLGKKVDAEHYLAPTAEIAGGRAIFPENAYIGVTTGILGKALDPPDYSSLRLVAVRFDPCTALTEALTKDSAPKCTASPTANQLRLIFQSESNDAGTSMQLDDDGFHVIYALPRAALAKAIADVTALRIKHQAGFAADLGPLAVHPILKRQTMSGPMAAELNALIQTTAGQGALIAVAGFKGNFGQQTNWSFKTVAMPTGEATDLPVPTLPPNGTGRTATPVKVENVNLSTPPDGFTQLSFPANTTPDHTSVAPLLDGLHVQNVSKSVQQAAFDAATRVENPNLFSALTIDCATCHTAQVAREIIAPKLALTAGPGSAIFVPSASFPKKDLAETTHPKLRTDLTLNLHAFSYVGKEAMIAPRTINETVRLVEYVNAPYFTRE